MKLETLLERIKTALKSRICLHCEHRLPESGLHFCVKCVEALGLRQPQAVVDFPSFVCHAATLFNPAVKKVLYEYKFHHRVSLEPQLANLLIDYWEGVLYQSRWREYADNVLVVPIPSHGDEKSRITGFARRFSKHYGYDFRSDALFWLRDIEPQHTLHEKKARFVNIAGSLQVNQQLFQEYKAILVLDDLTTTGATLHEATRAIRESLNEPLEIVTLAIAKIPLGGV
jgi:predicted amidophosphoribosyltransferase